MMLFKFLQLQRKRLFSLIFLSGIVLRGYLLWVHIGMGIQDADEATAGTMATHIAEGRHFPLIWYGQEYMGTLPSMISAVLFKCFGVSATAVRIVPILFSLLLIYLVYTLATELFGEPVGLLSGLWMAVCPPFLGMFSLKQAGYMGVLCLGTWLLLATYRLACEEQDARQTRRRLVLIGLLSGIGLWVHLQMFPYLLAAVCFCLLRARKILTFKNGVLVIVCFFIGSSPLTIYNLTHQNSNLLYFLNIFASADATPAYAIASRLYNTLVVNLPVLLSETPMWAFHWMGFTWYLPAALSECIGLSLLVAMSAFTTAVFVYRRLSEKAFFSSLSGTSRTYLVTGGNMILAILLIEFFLFGRYLQEFIPLLSGDAISWSQFPGAPVLTPSFLLTELFAPAMWMYLLYLPGIVYALYIVLTGRGERRAQLLLLLLTLFSVFGSSVGTHYGDLRSPRYIMPIYSVLPILFAWSITQLAPHARWLARLIPIALVSCHLFGLLRIPPELHLQPLHYVNWWNMEHSQLIPLSNQDTIAFLHSQNIAHIYAKYWLTTPFVFDSGERIIASTGLPGRYPPHDDLVQQAQTVAYLFQIHAPENAVFEALLQRANIRYAKHRVAYYDIYYNVGLNDRLSSPLWPAILKLLQFP